MRKAGESPSAFEKRKNCNKECAAKARGIERGEKTRHQSRHASPDGSSRWVSAAQYLAEVMVERQARKQGKELPIKFWDVKPWKGLFRHQLTLANALLKDFSPAAVSRALRSREGRAAFSLKAPWLRAIIERSEKEVIREKEAIVPPLPLPESSVDSEIISRPTFVSRPSLLTTLERSE